MKIYCVRMFNDETDAVVGYATTKEKAEKMIEILRNTDGFEGYEYEYYYTFTDTLEINDTTVSV